MKVLSWTGYEMTVCSDKYLYRYACSPYITRQVRKCIKHGAIGKAWQIIRKSYLIERKEI